MLSIGAGMADELRRPIKIKKTLRRGISRFFTTYY